MSTKKAKKPARSVRYLLSANPRLQRISLKRLSAGDKSVKRRPRASAAKESSPPPAASPEPMSKESAERPLNQAAAPTPSSAPSSAPWTISSRAIAITAVGVTAFAVLMATRQPTSSVDAADVDRQLQADRLEVATAGASLDTRPVAPVPAPAAVVPPPVAVESSARPAASPAIKPTIAAPKASTAESAVKAPAAEPVAKAAVVEPAAKASATSASAKPATESTAAAPATESAVKAPSEPGAKLEPQSAAVIKITGCLETNDEKAYRLTDTIGQDAPKSRSWKSGFLKKRSSNIEVVDAGHTLDLEHHVGQRVEATGTLTNREMKAQSLRQIAAKCE